MTNEIQVIPENEIAVAFQTFTAKELFERVKEQATSIVFDLSNPKDRTALKSHVYKIRQSKTAFDNHGSELKKQYTEVTSKIDAERKVFKTSCDDLIAELLAPFVEIELAEKKRVEDIELRISEIKNYLNPVYLDNSAQIKANIANLKAIEINGSFQEFESQAKLAKYETLEELEKALAYRLNLENEEAENKRIAEEQAEALRIQEEEAAKQRQVERDEQIKQQTILQAQKDNEDKERELVRQKEQAEEQARIAEEQAALKIKQAEESAQRKIQQEKERVAAEKKAADEAEAKRQANKAHQKKICAEILKSLIDLGQSEESAKILINHIHSGKVAHVSIQY